MTPFEVISVAGLLSGILDLTATSTLVRAQGVQFERLLQTIASGAFGSSAYQEGKKAATAGFFFHFFIALTVATVYYAASRKMTMLLDHPVLSGLLYGAAVHLLMSRVVVPLSAAPKREFSVKAFLTQLVIHMCFVGLPISLTVSYFAR